MVIELERFISKNCQWDNLPSSLKKLMGNSKVEYDKQVVEYSIKTQRIYIGNLVQQIINDPKSYYKEMISFSQSHLMMFPYHLSELVVRGLRITPFQYYCNILVDIMTSEKSYDSLPNFTAADCLRLLGIGRNQYIELMNQWRSGRKLFRRKQIKELLPVLPKQIMIEKWWIVKPGCITEDDVKNVSNDEKAIIDILIDTGPQRAGALKKEMVQSLYSKGLVYLDIPVDCGDCLCVPPLEGFVMNRILGDYFENLLYKIFVSMDERTCVDELSKVLEIDLEMVKIAVSLFCRLGFAQRKSSNDSFNDDSSWTLPVSSLSTPTADDLLLLELESALAESSVCDDEFKETNASTATMPGDENFGISFDDATQKQRIAFLYDSTLTAFLMMGNLSPGLKNHAVTMFEVGKMLDESLDSLLVELGKIQRSDSEGEAQRYFEHALTLRTTIEFLRDNLYLQTDENNASDGKNGSAVDLIRWESLSNLDPATTARLLNKNYQFLISMAPLSYEIPRVDGAIPPHFGPSAPEVNSVWFKLYIYNLTGCGPPSLLLPRGERISKLPETFYDYEKFLVAPWGHDASVVPMTNIFFTVNEALLHSPVFIQAYGNYHDVLVEHIPFPLDAKCKWAHHTAIQNLNTNLDLSHTFGYIKMVSFASNKPQTPVSCASEIQTGVPQLCSTKPVRNLDNFNAENRQDWNQYSWESKDTKDACWMDDWMVFECNFGLPLFDEFLNKEISSRIIERNLISKDCVQDLSSASAKLVENLNNFTTSFNGEKCRFSVRKHLNENASHLPLPTRPIFFCGEILQFSN